MYGIKITNGIKLLIYRFGFLEISGKALKLAPDPKSFF